LIYIRIPENIPYRVFTKIFLISESNSFLDENMDFMSIEKNGRGLIFIRIPENLSYRVFAKIFLIPESNSFLDENTYFMIPDIFIFGYEE